MIDGHTKLLQYLLDDRDERIHCLMVTLDDYSKLISSLHTKLDNARCEVEAITRRDPMGFYAYHHPWKNLWRHITGRI